MQKAQKLFCPNWKQQKTHLVQQKTSKNKTIEKKFKVFFSKTVSSMSHSAENPKETSIFTKLWVSCKN